MSYSPIIEALPESLRQPNRLALIASVAFHGVAFAILPFLPSTSKGINSQRVVNLIDLSPAEQSRVPQGSSTAQNLPSGLPPLGIGSLPPNLPDYRVGQSSPFNPSEAYQLPDLSSSVITVPIPQRNQLSENSSPAPTIARLPSAKDFELPNVPSIPPFDPNKLLPEVDPGNPTVPPGSPPTPFSAAVAPRPPSPPNQPAAPTPPVPVGPVEKWLAQTQQVAPDPKIALQESTVSLPYPPEACKNRLEGNSKVAAFVDPGGKLVALESTVGGLKLIDSTGSPTLNAVALNPKNYAIVANGQYQRLVFNSEFKYSEEACRPAQPTPAESPPVPQASSQSMDQLLAQARQEHDSKLVLEPATIPYTYPKAACEDKLKGLASVVAIVKPDGGLAEKPQITKSTGHQVLDQTAIDIVANHKFAPTSQYQAYVSGFGFEPTEKACAGKPTPQSSTENSQKPESKPSSKPPAKATPSPSPTPSVRTTPALPQLEAAPTSPTPGAIEETPTPTPEPTEAAPTPSPETTEETPAPSPEG